MKEIEYKRGSVMETNVKSDNFDKAFMNLRTYYGSLTKTIKEEHQLLERRLKKIETHLLKHQDKTEVDLCCTYCLAKLEGSKKEKV